MVFGLTSGILFVTVKLCDMLDHVPTPLHRSMPYHTAVSEGTGAGSHATYNDGLLTSSSTISISSASQFKSEFTSHLIVPNGNFDKSKDCTPGEIRGDDFTLWYCSRNHFWRMLGHIGYEDKSRND